MVHHELDDLDKGTCLSIKFAEEVHYGIVVEAAFFGPSHSTHPIVRPLNQETGKPSGKRFHLVDGKIGEDGEATVVSQDDVPFEVHFEG